ncbi:MAG: efflux RND transporter permease subunit, partial [Acidobacteriota bacterium]
MSLPAACARRPIAVMMVTLAVCTFGWLAVRRLAVNLLPDLSYPTLTIQTVYPDAAPVSVEQFITRPVEEGVGVVAGVREMRSISRSGLSEVILEFDWNEQMDFAAMAVREKRGMVQLPREAEPPRVLRFDPSLDPIIRMALWGDRPLDDLRRVAERWLKPRLEAVRGVAAARVRGGLEPEVVVEADEDRLEAFGLTLDDLSTALKSENVNQPSGTLKDFHAVYLV